MSGHIRRIQRELVMLAEDPGPGISAWPVEGNMLHLEAQIQGPHGSPYEEGTYTLHVHMSERYPLEPPRVRFLTPIYHPNIDSDGRICLDTLKMQPQGTWSPSININTLLLTIRLLMAQPNADDGLVPEITEEFKRDPSLWRRRALQHTLANAVMKNKGAPTSALVPALNTVSVEAISYSSQSSTLKGLDSDASTSSVTGTGAGVNRMILDTEGASVGVKMQTSSLIETDTKESTKDKQYVHIEEADVLNEEDMTEEEEERESDDEVTASIFADASSKRPRFL